MIIKELTNKWTEDNKDAMTHIFLNRGFAPNEIKKYIEADMNDVSSFKDLGEDNLKAAATALIQCISENKKAIIVIDSDCDGYTSSAVFINYLYNIFPSWIENNLDIFMHDGKQHGLSDCIEDILMGDYKLVVCPDSSSNDYEEHRRLKEKNIDVVVLDHHEAEKISENAIIINNQLSNYKNKELSGVGVTWQFCRYLDSLLEKDFSNRYLDLVALGLMADMMSLASTETKVLIQEGFKSKNLRNPFIYGMSEKNAYSLGGRVTPIGAAFYIAPFVNATVRSGTLEEKQLLFDSMLEYKAFEEIPSTKRGHSFGEMEKLYEQALRTCTNVKNRQTRAQDAGLDFLENLIEENNMLEHKILLFLLEPGQVDKNIAGLIANKFMAKYQRPCCILTKTTATIDDSLIVSAYQGSARGYNKSGIESFKDVCEESLFTLYQQGHANAFGLGISADEGVVENFIQYMDKIYENINPEPIYYSDYIWSGDTADGNAILSISELDNYWGTDIDEPYVAIKNLKVTSDMISIYQKKTNTIKIHLPKSNVDIMKFCATEDEVEKFRDIKGYIELDVVGRCSKNEFNGVIKPQILVEDYEQVDSSKYFF